MATASQLQSSGADSIPKTLVLALYAIAFTVGLAPFALFLQWPEFLGLALLLVMVAVAIAGWRAKQLSGPLPPTGELVLAMLGALGLGALCGIFGFLSYPLFKYGYDLFAWLIGAGPSSFAAYPAGGVAIFFALAVGANQLPTFLDRLYPPSKSQPSVFQSLARDWWRLLLRVIGVIAGIVALACIAYPPAGALGRLLADNLPSTTTLLVAVDLYWLFITQALWDPGDEESPKAANLRLAGKVKTLLEAAGFRVKIHPQTGDAEADALVSLLDFLAVREDRALAGRITFIADRLTLKREMATLPQAVWALEEKLSRTTSIALQPMAFLVGDSALADDAAGWSMSRTSSPGDQQVSILHFVSEAELDAIIAARAGENPKRDRVMDMLGSALPPSPEPVAAP